MLKDQHRQASQPKDSDSDFSYAFMKASDETLMLDNTPVSTDLLFRVKTYKNESFNEKTAIAGVGRFDPGTKRFVDMPNDYGYSLLNGLERITSGEAKTIKRTLIGLAVKYGNDILPPPPEPNSHGAKNYNP